MFNVHFRYHELTRASVVFKDGKEVFISNPAEFPDTTDPKARVEHVEEPMVNATIFVPNGQSTPDLSFPASRQVSCEAELIPR
jgi:translation elongation factor EF-4